MTYAEAMIRPLLKDAILLKEGRPLRIVALRPRSLAPFFDFPIAEAKEAVHDIVTAHLEALLKITVPESSIGPLFDAQWQVELGDLSTDGSWIVPARTDPDFVFSYPLPHAQSPSNLAEYGAETLAILLDVVDLLADGRPVVPDQIVLRETGAMVDLPAPSQLLELGPRSEGSEGTGSRQPLHSVASTAPYFPAIARHWALLASLLRLANKPGQRIEGFQLRRTADWVVPSSGHPSEVYQYLARVCNVACKFCYLYGNPAGLAVARGSKVISGGELNTRLRHYDPVRGRALFPSQWEINEFLVDPKLPDVLRELRRRSPQAFFFITNGNPLSPRVIDLLAEVKPVHLIISTNTFDAPLRSATMRESESQTRTALDCLQRLVDVRIPFGVSLVALPDFPPAQLADTILRLNELRPAFIRVNLPGFTRDHPFPLTFDIDRVWTEAVTMIQNLRASVQTPLLTIPSAFEENFLRSDPHEVRVLGVLPGSPAARCGLSPGDVVTRLGSSSIESRAQLQALLLLTRNPVVMQIDRDGARIVCRLDPDTTADSPYLRPVFGKYLFPHGLVVAPSISLLDVDAVRTAMEDGRVRQAWVVTSPIMLPAARTLFHRHAPELLERLHFVVTRSEFLGGNIQVLDMCTIGDISRAVSRELGTRRAPDMIFLPSTGFNELGRDLAGRHWGDLERWFGIRVCLLHVTAQFLF
jgi:hypothetical protein